MGTLALTCGHVVCGVCADTKLIGRFEDHYELLPQRQVIVINDDKDTAPDIDDDPDKVLNTADDCAITTMNGIIELAGRSIHNVKWPRNEHALKRGGWFHTVKGQACDVEKIYKGAGRRIHCAQIKIYDRLSIWCMNLRTTSAQVKTNQKKIAEVFQSLEQNNWRVVLGHPDRVPHYPQKRFVDVFLWSCKVVEKVKCRYDDIDELGQPLFKFKATNYALFADFEPPYGIVEAADDARRLSVDFMYIIDMLHNHMHFMKSLEEEMLKTIEVVESREKKRLGKKFVSDGNGLIMTRDIRAYLSQVARDLCEETVHGNKYHAEEFVHDYIFDSEREPMPPLWDVVSPVVVSPVHEAHDPLIYLDD
jgi:hypothetical protein